MSLRAQCSALVMFWSVVLLLMKIEGNSTPKEVHEIDTSGSLLVKKDESEIMGCTWRPWICSRGEFPPRTMCCGDRCVDVTSDINNCGLCGNRCGRMCPIGRLCIFGRCAFEQELSVSMSSSPRFPPLPPEEKLRATTKQNESLAFSNMEKEKVQAKTLDDIGYVQTVSYSIYLTFGFSVSAATLLFDDSRDASKRRCAIRTSSVGLTMPASFERFWILVIVCTVEPKTRSRVAATVFMTMVPRPCFKRSSPLTTKFRIGFAKESIKMNAIWIIKTCFWRLVRLAKNYAMLFFPRPQEAQYNFVQEESMATRLMRIKLNMASKLK
ncbi:hypothetical protein CR513_07839, partial [Mucuna pruriens]